MIKFIFFFIFSAGASFFTKLFFWYRCGGLVLILFLMVGGIPNFREYFILGEGLSLDTAGVVLILLRL